jgi:hypothetical protein
VSQFRKQLTTSATPKELFEQPVLHETRRWCMISAFWFLMMRIGRMGLVIMVMNLRVLQNKGLLTCFSRKVLCRAVGVACTALVQTWL